MYQLDSTCNRVFTLSFSLNRGVYALYFSLDPDILVGYEIQMLSWGYLLQRGATLNMNLCARISRLPSKYNNTSPKKRHHSLNMRITC